MPLPLELDDSNTIAGAMAGEFVDAAAGGSYDDAASRQLARVLIFITMLLDLLTALYRAPNGVVFKTRELAYYLTLATILAFGMAEVFTAFCLSRYRSSWRVHAFARLILYISVLPLVGVIAVGGFAVFTKTKKNSAREIVVYWEVVEGG